MGCEDEHFPLWLFLRAGSGADIPDFGHIKECQAGLLALISSSFLPPQVNVMAVSICTREAYQSMKERNIDDGHIININR